MLKEKIYLQGCKHTLCLGGICLGNWEKWRALLLVLSPTFHIDLQASLQNCFSLKCTQHEKKSERLKLWKGGCLASKDVRPWRWRLPAVSFLVAPDNPSMRRLATTVRAERQIHFWWKPVTRTYCLFCRFLLFLCTAWFQLREGWVSKEQAFQVLGFRCCTPALC